MKTHALTSLALILLALAPVASAVTTTNINQTRVLTNDGIISNSLVVGDDEFKTEYLEDFWGPTLKLAVEGSAAFNGTLFVNKSPDFSRDFLVACAHEETFCGFMDNPVLTGSRTWTFQDASGTLGLIDAPQTVTALWTFGTNAALSGSTITSGTISDARLSSNVLLRDGVQSVTGAKTFDPSTLILDGPGAGAVTFAYANTANSHTATFPDNTGTVAETNLAQSWTGLQTFGTGVTLASATALLLTPTTSGLLPAAVQGALVYDSTNDRLLVGKGVSPAYQAVATLGTAQTWTAAQTFSTAPTFSTITPGSVLFGGTGGLLSQDNANFFWTDSTNRLGIGTASPSSILHLAGTSGTTTITYNNAADSASGSQVNAFKSRGASLSSPTIVSNGDGVFALQGFGYDGASYLDVANIVIQVDGAPGTNDMPGRIMFSTTSDGASTLTERLRITSTGQIQAHAIGSTAGVLVGGDWLIYRSATDEATAESLILTGNGISSGSGKTQGFFGSAGTTKQTWTLTGADLTDNSGGTSGENTITNIGGNSLCTAGTCADTATTRNAVATLADAVDENTADIAAIKTILANYGLVG